MQIIVFALVMGVVTFLGIALVVNGAGIEGEPDILSWLGLGIAALMIAAHLIVPRISASAALSQVSTEEVRNADDDRKFELIAPAYQGQLIVACALLEGAAFLNLVGYMLNEYVGNLFAAMALVAMIAAKIPTLSRVEFWVQDRAREIEMR